MIERRALSELTSALNETPAVCLIGPRQVGKTTLALEVAADRPSLYLDLESPAARAKLADAEFFLGLHADKLVILDEVHRAPEIFQSLRGLIDRGRLQGRRHGRFLLLGSASVELLKQTGESLAGRVAFIELCPIDVLEIPAGQALDLWVRGGFPDSLLAGSEEASSRWRRNFIKTYLERDIPQFGPRIPAETLRRFWTMLAHSQGTLLNASKLAGSLGVTGKTVAAYLDLLVDLLLVRRLSPWHTNASKRLMRSPKIYVRDSGLVHALIGLRNMEEILGHPVAGQSWEGFVLENLLAAAPGAQPGFYRSTAGAEIDLILQFPGGAIWAIEVKRSLAPKLERGFHSARADLRPERSFVVYPGADRYSLSEGLEVISLQELCRILPGIDGG